MNYICESCGSDLKYYDKVSRMVRTKNRKASIITVKRFKCPVCNCIHRNLPNNIFPYKQYDARIITGVIEGKITSDMIDYEDYPCEMTMTMKPKINQLINKSVVQLKRGSPTVLTCLGVAGVIATTVSAVMATPKAIEKIRKDSLINHDGDPCGYSKTEAIKGTGSSVEDCD